MKNDKPRKIESIVDKKGVVYESQNAINLFKPITKEFHEARMKDEFVCNCCGMPIMFTSNGATRYIKHKPMKEKSECPWHSDVALTKEQADALKYNGAKEGKKHIYYKEFLFNMFKESEEYTNEALETRRTISVDSMIRWRQPDVFATYKNNINIACEVQLQTILMTHIKERRKFYEKDNTFMMWFFEDRDIKDYRFSDGDIFFTNNQNGFFLNEKSIELSKINKELVVGVKYYDFVLDENLEIEFESKTKFVKISEITFNKETREVYYFDSRAKYRELEEESFIKTPVKVGEEFDWDGIKFIILMAKSNYLHINYQTENDSWIGGKYHDFHKNIHEAKKSIVLKT